jgi:hypothetical protein
VVSSVIDTADYLKSEHCTHTANDEVFDTAVPKNEHRINTANGEDLTLALPKK